MSNLNQTLFERANIALADVGKSMPPLSINLGIEIRITSDSGENLLTVTSTDCSDRWITLFLESRPTQVTKAAPGMLSNLRDVIQPAAPLLLDSARQLVNKLVRYKPGRHFIPTVSPNDQSIEWSQGSAAPVLLVGMNWLEVGGAEAFAIETAELASTMGFRVVILCGRVGKLSWLSRVAHFAERIYMLGRLDVQTRESVCFQLVRDLKPRLIHINHCEVLYKILPRLRSADFKNRIVDSTHIVENRHGGFVSKSQMYSPWIDCHHVISKTLEKFYRQAGISSEKIRLGYLCRDVPGTPKPTQRNNGPLRIGFVGRFVQQKRPYLFTELARQLSLARPNAFEFEMIGDGLLENLITNQIQSGRVPVTLHEAQTNVPEFMSRLDLLIICSDIEGLTLVAFEAISRGCAVVSADVGAQRELIEPPMLLPIEPYAFLRAAIALLLNIFDGTTDINSIKNQQRAKYSHLCSEPSALQVCRELYGECVMLKEPSDYGLFGR